MILKHKHLPLTRLSLVAMAAFTLSACERPWLVTPTEVTPNRVQVEESVFDYVDHSQAYTPATVTSMAEHYSRYGDGDVKISVLYDPFSKTNTARYASQEAARIAGLFRENGVTKIDVDITPVHALQQDSKTVVSYLSYTAKPPKDCGQIATFRGEGPTYFEDYKYGCEIETILAKQVLRPKDLLGQDGSGTSDSERQYNILKTHRSGARARELDSYSSTDQ